MSKLNVVRRPATAHAATAPPKAVKRPKIFWTLDERILVFRELQRLEAAGLKLRSAPERWGLAQRILPEDRQRPIGGSVQASAVTKLYKQWIVDKSASAILAKELAEAEAQRDVLRATQRAQAIPPIHTVPQSTDGSLSRPQVFPEYGHLKPDSYAMLQAHFEGSAGHAPTLAPTSRPTLDSVLSALITEQAVSMLGPLERRLDGLATEVAKLAAMWSPVETEPPSVLPGEQFEQAETPLPTKSHKPRICLVNAQSVQRSAVQAAFPQFEVRTVDGRPPGEQHVDLVVGFTKFMSHAVEKACISKFGDKYVRISGSASDAIRRIKRFEALTWTGGLI